MSQDYVQGVGEVIRTARISLAMTQEELARRVKVSRQSVNAWENETAFPSLENMSRVMTLLDLSPEEVFSVDHPAMRRKK